MTAQEQQAQGAGREVRLGALARVEGEGAVRLLMRDGDLDAVRLEIFEPPRFFEAFLAGRAHTEPPDLTSRVCGICPVAYQMSAARAVEDACGTVVDGRVEALRRLLYCGEWIESQTMHICLLHAPDFLGAADIVELAGSAREHVERGLRLKQAGNAIVETLGGRAVHPVNARVGGFYRVPAARELEPLRQTLRRALDDAAATLEWVSAFDFPDADCDHDLLALAEPGTYAVEAGTPTVMPAPGSAGLTADSTRPLPTRSFPVAAFEEHVSEHQVPHSTALHARLDGRRHLTGSLARYAISGRWLPPEVQEAARNAGLGDPAAGEVCRNPYRSIVVRAVEVLYAVTEALRIIDGYEPPASPHVEVRPRAATGHGATEAPRGLLYHRYTLHADGTVAGASLIPPTSQNQGAIEEDLRVAVRARLREGAVGDEELARLCERVVRNHDPCISCSAHFLRLTVEHEGWR